MDLDLVGQQNKALGAFVPLISIEVRSLHGTPVRSKTYYPEHILTYRSRKTCYSLVMGSSSFQIDCYRWIIGLEV
jgi:hypothetical protein